MAMMNFPPQAYTRDVLTAAYEWLRTQPNSIKELARDADSLVALYLKSRRNLGAISIAPKTQAPTDNIRANVASALEQAILPGGLDELRGTVEIRSGSANAFKEDLKTLAEGLKQFEGEKTDHLSVPQTAAFAPSVSVMSMTQPSPPPTPSPQQQAQSLQQHQQPPPSRTTHGPHMPAPAPQVTRSALHYPQSRTPLQNGPAGATISSASPVVAPTPTPIPTDNMPPVRATVGSALASNTIAPAASGTTNFMLDLTSLDPQSLMAIQMVQSKFNLSHPNEAIRLLISLGFDRAKEILPKT
jgi:hypothetical protein